MASIGEHGVLWTLTEPAARLLENEGYIEECHQPHVLTFKMDRPIFHVTCGHRGTYSGSAEGIRKAIDRAHACTDPELPHAAACISLGLSGDCEHPSHRRTP